MSQPTETSRSVVSRSGRPVQPSNKATSRAKAKQQAQRKVFTRWLFAGVGIALLAVAVLTFLDHRSQAAAVIPGGPDKMSEVVNAPVFSSANMPKGMTAGQVNAPITVIWYGDYKDEDSTLFARQSLSKLLDGYVATGKIRLEYSPFPALALTDGTFDTESESFRAAEAAMCANDQGMFWPFNGALYANTVGETLDSFPVDRIKQIGAQTPGLDTEAFNACVDARTHQAEVLAAGNLALERGIESAPTFSVNGQPVTSIDLANLESVIDTQLAGP